MTMSKNNSIRLAAVGDLLFTVKPGGNPERGLEALSDEIRTLFVSCDIVFANLESTLPGDKTVITEPRCNHRSKILPKPPFKILPLELKGTPVCRRYRKTPKDSC